MGEEAESAADDREGLFAWRVEELSSEVQRALAAWATRGVEAEDESAVGDRADLQPW